MEPTEMPPQLPFAPLEQPNKQRTKKMNMFYFVINVTKNILHDDFHCQDN